MSSALRPDNPWKHVAVAFLVALVIYVVAYSSIEHRRVRKGPWRVTFATDANSHSPYLLINQPTLGLTNIQILFLNEVVPLGAIPMTNAFDQPQPVPFPVPFGQCVFMDTTFLPGTLTLRLFGHEIELLPRTMIVDHVERPWASSQKLILQSLAGTSLHQQP